MSTNQERKLFIHTSEGLYLCTSKSESDAYHIVLTNERNGNKRIITSLFEINNQLKINAIFQSNLGDPFLWLVNIDGENVDTQTAVVLFDSTRERDPYHLALIYENDGTLSKISISDQIPRTSPDAIEHNSKHKAIYVIEYNDTQDGLFAHAYSSFIDLLKNKPNNDLNEAVYIEFSRKGELVYLTLITEEYKKKFIFPKRLYANIDGIRKLNPNDIAAFPISRFIVDPKNDLFF